MLLYLAIGGKLAGVIAVADPLREEAAGVVKDLQEAGFTKVVMLTGDSERTARTIAEQVGVDDFRAEVLPEDKCAYVTLLQEEGHTVLIAVGCAVVIPLSKIIMDAIYPYLVANVACGMNLTFPWWIYAAVFAGIMAVYFLIHALLVRRIGQVNLGEVLKTRE